MGLPIVKNRMTGTAVARAIPAEGVYDTEGLAAAATSQLGFYSNQINTADSSGGIAKKFYGETNMIQPGQLPKGYRFQMQALNLKYFSNLIAGAVLVPADYDKIKYGTATGGAGWLEFQISSIVVCRKPLSDMPMGVMPIAYGSATAANTPENINQGIEHITNRVGMAVKGQHPTIESGESFGATVTWGLPITVSIAYRFFIIAHGILFRPL